MTPPHIPETSPESLVIFGVAAFCLWFAAVVGVGKLLDWLVGDDEIDCGGNGP